MRTSACANFNKCIDACPTKAISSEGYRINPFRCLSFINRHADEPCREMPEDALELDRWLYGCEVCQDICPLNANAVSEDVLSYNMEYITFKNYYKYLRLLKQTGAT
ncbi:4Fe-4S double cluster binding domain-containing protein [Chloroflexota bacterium]